MRFNLSIVFLAAAILLAKAESGGPGQTVEVHATNASVEITGWDGDRVQVSEPGNASVNDMNGRVVVEVDAPDQMSPLKVQVPWRAPLEVNTSNGAIHVSGMKGALKLTTSNGAIVVRDAGASEIHARSSNGMIEVGAPRDLNANVSARTSNGQIHSDFEILTHRTGNGVLEGKIGDGGAAIELQTSNGSIYLKSGGEQERVVSTFRPGEVK